uniref:Putative conserved secreted protein n=1 Tax=Nyssomyia neivai TaxID=330878 RepID=A0A1L8DP83_9DIPT
MDFMKFVAYCVLFAAFCNTCSALECYVCANQSANSEKCLKTIKTCEPGEDVCLTEIRWGSMPYFSQGALKQYYVSKRCSTKEICQKIRSRYMPYCTHIWYEDWSCSECCQGDRCNYFIISGANDLRAPLTVMILGAIFLIRRFT